MNRQSLDVNLRSLSVEDAAVLMELNNNQDVAKFVVGTPQIVTIEQQLQWMSKLQHETNTVRWMVTYDGEAVGTVILSSIDYVNSVGNMNIKLLPSYHGRGIAKMALSLACDSAFDELGLFCLTANILPYNTASYMLFRKVGFQQDGILRGRVVKGGERHDLITLSYLKTERVQGN